MIQRLRLKGFRKYDDQTFELQPGVTFIDGHNNAGKTTLFLAIEYALTGTVAGARSQSALLNPGAKGLGVELVFTGKDGKTYRLQRVHQLPPKARSKLNGFFTLKEIIGEGDERYVLSSDFQDHESALAGKLQELTGISRRVLDLAVHVRQGEIPSILDGDPRLDIALGITAAGTANEEMRALALEDERAIETLPALEASLEHIEKQRKAATSDQGGLEAKLKKLEKEIEALEAGDAEDLDEKLETFSEAVDAWREAVSALERETEELAEVQQNAVPEKELAAVEKRAAQRLELAARIERRAELVETGASTCEHCGAPIEGKKAKAELVAWQTELKKLEAAAKDDDALLEKKAALARVPALKASVAEATASVKASESAARKLGPKGDDRALDTVLTAWRKDLEKQKVEAARNEAKREALAGQADELRTRLEEEGAKSGDLDKEHARLTSEVTQLRKCRRRAEDLRALAAAYKTLQEELRTTAAQELGDSVMEIHQALSVDAHTLEKVTIDPARYQVLVTPKDHGEELPASLSQGGGHRLLLGLAFRLALVKRLGPFPFVLLDEPTYGLDARHRAALLERIAGLKLCDQILLITHQDMGSAQGQRIHVGKKAEAA